MPDLRQPLVATAWRVAQGASTRALRVGVTMLAIVPPPFLTDAEVAEICAPLTNGAAQVRYLQRIGLAVQRKPNGRPLLMRSELERVLGAGRMMQIPDVGQAARAGGEPDLGALLHVIQGGRRGKTSQGR